MRRKWLPIILLAALVSPPAVAAEPAPPEPGQTTRLSNETTRSHWAYIGTRVWARRAPGKRARRIKRLLTYVSGTGSPELVLALREHRLADGRLWVQVRLPMRPNDRTGWVPREALERLRLVRTRLVIRTARMRATLFRGGRRVWTARVGVGTRRWPTPRGRFYIRERLAIPRGPERELYGPLALGTSALSPTLSGGNWGEGVVGVHGTGYPELIPGRISHGCVRVRNSGIRRLWRLAPLGTPVRITR